MHTRGCMHVLTLLISESYIQYGLILILQDGKEQPTDPHAPLAQSVSSTLIAAANSCLFGTQVVLQT